MFNSFSKTVVVLCFAACGAALSTTAGAACFAPDTTEPQMQKESWNGSVALMPVDWRERHHDDVVGYWNIVVSSKGNTGIPDGTVLDKGLQQWHEDGTEMLNSSSQHPATQNYCLGVWEKTGESTYVLNHFAYSYNTNQEVIGLVRIREQIVVKDNGSRMVGTQTVDIYDTLRNHLQQIKGTLVGKRITIDTTAQDVL